MGERTSGSQAELRSTVVERLAATQKSAPLSRRLVGEAAVACGVSERTMWRWIACGGPPPRQSRGIVAGERAAELLLAWRGNVAAVHRQLVEEGEDVPSRQTLGHAFERALSPAQRDVARRGDLAVRDRAVYLRHEARFRAECYEGDHKQLSIEVLAPRTDAYCPWQKGKIERLNRTIEQELLQGLPGWTGGPRDVRGRLVDRTPWTLERFVAVFADWVGAYNTARPHTALAGRTPLEAWWADPTSVRTLEHQEARWMLLARCTHVVQKDGIHHNSAIYFTDELWGMAGEEVEVAHMPHDRRWIEVFHEGRWLATARPSVEFDADTRARVLERRREDEKELKAWARRARRRVRVRVAPITGPGEIEPLDPPLLPAETEPSTGRATLGLLGWEGQLNQPLEERDDLREHGR